MNEAGLIGTSSINASIKSGLGGLDREIRRMWKDIEWGATTSEAMARFEERARTAMITRTTTLIIKANEVVSVIRRVLQIAAADAEAPHRLKQNRLGNMAEYAEYVMVVYLSFFVFPSIVYVFAAQFVTRVPVGAAAENLSEGRSMLAQYDADRYILPMFHAPLIRGFCSGLVAGEVGSGSAYSELKHLLIMVAIGVPDLYHRSGWREGQGREGQVVSTIISECKS